MTGVPAAYADPVLNDKTFWLVATHKVREVIYLTARFWGFPCPPMLVTVANRKTGKVSHGEVPMYPVGG